MNLAPIVIGFDMRAEPAVSSAQALRGFDEPQLRNTPFICNTAWTCRALLSKHAMWQQELNGGWLKTHLISLSHVAVEDPSHALDGRVLQLMGPPHIVINAPGEQGEHKRGFIKWMNRSQITEQGKSHYRNRFIWTLNVQAGKSNDDSFWSLQKTDASYRYKYAISRYW